MKNSLLIPHKYKAVGWTIFSITALGFLINTQFAWYPSFLSFEYKDGASSEAISYTEVNLLKEVIFALWMIGLFMIAFSKEKQEDEYLSFLRLKCWQYAALISMIISLLGTLMIYGINYLTFVSLNMLTSPVVFILIFSFNLYRFKREGARDEK